MTNVAAVTAASTFLSLFLLWFLFHWLYRDYRVDYFRQRMFALRDELFDLAREGVVPFDHPAYGLLRTTLNGFIRFGHRVRPFTLIWITYWLAKDQVLQAQTESFMKRWDEATGTLEYPVAKRLNELRERAHAEVAEQLVLSSMALMSTIVPVVILVFFSVLRSHFSRHIAKPIKRWWRDAVDRVDTTALTVGAS